MDAVNLLWTGGWDSTFRLLQAIIVSKKKVSPYYLIDMGRKSVMHELRTMEKIRETLFRDFPHTQNQLEPLTLFLKDEIPMDEELSQAYDEMMQEMPMGVQYKWLANFCKVKGIRGLEISFEEHAGMPRYDFIRKHLALSGENHEKIHVADSKYSHTNFYRVFRDVHWPIIDVSRQKMEEIAREHHFLHILNQTWFCHQPIGKSMPCGICTPCIQVAEMGNRKRLPLRARIRYRFRNVLSVKNFKQAYPKLYKIIKPFNFNQPSKKD